MPARVDLRLVQLKTHPALSLPAPLTMKAHTLGGEERGLALSGR
jgi:hypothetical protein